MTPLRITSQDLAAVTLGPTTSLDKSNVYTSVFEHMPFVYNFLIPETCKMSARALGLFTFEVSGLRSTTMTLLCEVGGAAVVRAGVVMGPRGTEGGFCSTGAPELPLKVFPMVILVGTS